MSGRGLPVFYSLTPVQQSILCSHQGGSLPPVFNAKESFVRAITGLFAIGLLTLGLVVPGYAAPDMKSYSNEGVSISLPPDWQMVSGDILKQSQQRMGNRGKVIFMAEAPDSEVAKLIVMESPRGINNTPMSSADLEALDPAKIKDICQEFVAGATQINPEGKPTCERVKTDKGAALVTSLTIKQPNNGPSMENMTWMYPRGKASIVATALYMEKDKAKYGPLLKDILVSLNPGK